MEKPSYSTISVERRCAADWVTLNRPERLNALDHATVDDLGRYFSSAGEDPACRVIVLRGSGRAFCAGVDIKETTIHRWEDAVAADVRVAEESGRMNAAFIRIGFAGSDMGSNYFLPRLVGAPITSELLLTGCFADATRALRIGHVSEVVSDAHLEAAGQALVDDMLATGPLGHRLTKETLSDNVNASLDEAIALEDRNQSSAP